MIIAPNKKHCKRLTFGKWLTHFKPIKNYLNAHAPGDGMMFETFGPENAYVKDCIEKKPGCVWTLLDCDGKLVISNGYWFVNRLNYFVTEVPGDRTLPEIMYDNGRR
jgi:hypothetical protein